MRQLYLAPALTKRTHPFSPKPNEKGKITRRTTSCGTRIAPRLRDKRTVRATARSLGVANASTAGDHGSAPYKSQGTASTPARTDANVACPCGRKMYAPALLCHAPPRPRTCDVLALSAPQTTRDLRRGRGVAATWVSPRSRPRRRRDVGRSALAAAASSRSRPRRRRDVGLSALAPAASSRRGSLHAAARERLDGVSSLWMFRVWESQRRHRQ